MNARRESNSQARSTRIKMSFRLTVAAVLVGFCGMMPAVLGQSTSSPKTICEISSPPVSDQEFGQDLTMNRALALSAGDPGFNQAIRVTIDSVTFAHHKYLVGSKWWVQLPEAIGESSSSRAPVAGMPNFRASTLGCTPFFMDWNGVCVDGGCEGGLNDGTCQNSVCIGGPNDRSGCTSDADCPGDACTSSADCQGGIVNLYGEMLVPGASYSVSVVGPGCDLNDPVSFAAANLQMTTSNYGNVAGKCSELGCEVPDNQSTSVADALAVLMKMAGVNGAPRKMRADLHPSDLDFTINITDVLQSLWGFCGCAYPFLSCRSTNTAGSLCFGGPSDLQPCVTDADCRVPVCPG